MLTRFVRIQLTIFTALSIISLIVLVVQYIQAPTLLGIGRITVRLELPSSGGLYRFSNVTYRGVEVGKVTDVRVVTPSRVQATLSLATSPTIPSDLVANVRSMSAVGEQYVDLNPRTDTPPYLHDGSVITMRDTTIPQDVGPMLDQVSALINSIPQGKLTTLLDESFKGFNGAGYDFGSLFDSSAKLSGDLSAVAQRARSLIEDGVPLVDAQAQSVDALRVWTHSLAGVTEQLVTNDPQVRTLLQTGPGFAQEISQLLAQVKPTLPVLLANLATLGQVGVTYNPALEQLLVLLPPYIAQTQTFAGVRNNPTGWPLGEFAVTVGDPPACTVGFLPPSAWRSPADTTDIDTPDGLYCKLPQDSPIAVRGARNYPCMGHPGKRAPTVQICDSDKPFEPLAMRQHVLGPYPFDPNLISQGIPPDDRATADGHLYGPVEGTAPQPAQPPPMSAAPTTAVGVAPTDAQAPPPTAATVPSAAPAGKGVGLNGLRANGSGLPVALAQYNPDTGEYLGSDRKWYRQSDLVTAGAAKSWKDMVLMP